MQPSESDLTPLTLADHVSARVVATWRLLRSSVSLLRYQGPRWLLFRIRYSLKHRTGWFRRKLPCDQWQAEPTADLLERARKLSRSFGRGTVGTQQAVEQADRILAGQMQWFSKHSHKTTYPPNWFRNPWESSQSASDRRHWSLIGDFAAGDIKCIWEQARFGFVFTLVRAHSRTADPKYVEAFWKAVEDWRANNPPQQGPHWKCGQEIALRVMAWVFGLLHFVEHESTTPERRRQLREMLEVSGVRIAANIEYALSQSNNHGVSEASALFTLGILLGRRDWLTRGESLLNALAEELIYEDGTFSQHSTNYHRLMLHDYLWVIWLGRAAGRSLSDQTIRRVGKAGEWLHTLLSSMTGRVPNLGANDGAHFLNLTDLDYLDYRPVVQATGMLAKGVICLPRGPWDEMAEWLGADFSECKEFGQDAKGASGRCVLRRFSEGGYAVWRHAGMTAMLRCPTQFRHRPAQCDLLHFDLSDGEHNLLRDAGSYSYNCDEPWRSYFSSSAAHNTIRIDHRDPMPKVSRFLYDSWPVGTVTCQGQSVSACYRDYQGIRHRRTIRPIADGFRIEDVVEGRFKHAILRWRLDPQLAWTVTQDGCFSSRLAINIHVRAGDLPPRLQLGEGEESLYYLERSPLPVLEVQLTPECRTLVSEIRLQG